MNPSIVLVHFRKAGVKSGKPWTVHVRGKCIPATTVSFNVPIVSVFRPEKKSNPRAWFRAKGTVATDKYGNVVINP